MLVFEHIIQNQLEQLAVQADQLSKEVHRKRKRPREIELLLSAIEDAFSKLLKLMPPIKTDRVEAVRRHVAFVRGGLKENRVDWIEGNANDLKQFDIPTLKLKSGAYFREFAFLPPELRDEVAPLLENGEHDSAVRKAFLVIKQKAITKYHMPAQLDGEDMVFLFSESGKIRVHEDEKKRKAFRDFVSGFFRFFRNEFMHDLSADEHVPVQCALATAVFILQLMDNP
jgi:hypothetical protein